MDLQLAGDVAVVIGGANGIGRAMGAALSREGALVVLADYDARVAESAVRLADETGGACHARQVDVTDESAVCRLAEEVVTQFHRCDHVLYAVGAGSGKYGFPFWNLQPADWKRVWEVNLLGAVHVAHAFAPQLVRQRRGTMLFLSSVAGQIGSQTDPPYSAAKAALINFAQCAARDFAPYGVRVNTICPGMVKTDLNRSVWQAWYDRQAPEDRRSYEDWAGDKVRRVTPLARWQEPEDIAELAVFLASPRARNVTGQTWNVDGGQVMHW